MSQKRKFSQKLVTPEVLHARGVIVRSNGLTTPNVASAVYDAAGNDSAGVSNKTEAAHGLGVYIPINAIIVRAWYDVVTVFTSVTSDAATIALKIQGANDLVSANDIADSTNPYDAGLHSTLLGSPVLGAATEHDTALELGVLQVASFLKLTAERELTATVGVEAILTGKLVIFVEYVLSE